VIFPRLERLGILEPTALMRQDHERLRRRKQRLAPWPSRPPGPARTSDCGAARWSITGSTWSANWPATSSRRTMSVSHRLAGLQRRGMGKGAHRERRDRVWPTRPEPGPRRRRWCWTCVPFRFCSVRPGSCPPGRSCPWGHAASDQRREPRPCTTCCRPPSAGASSGATKGRPEEWIAVLRKR